MALILVTGCRDATDQEVKLLFSDKVPTSTCGNPLTLIVEIDGTLSDINCHPIPQEDLVQCLRMDANQDHQDIFLTVRENGKDKVTAWQLGLVMQRISKAAAEVGVVKKLRVLFFLGDVSR